MLEVLTRMWWGFVIAGGAAACNPEGTCIYPVEPDEICTVAYPESACDAMPGSTFHEENRDDGVARCLGAGFEIPRPAVPDMYFKHGR